jgi:hypothetical protein
MEIDRLTSGGEPLATVDIRMHFQTITMGNRAEFIEAVMTLHPGGGLDKMSSPTPDVPYIPDATAMAYLFTRRSHACRMPRPTLMRREDDHEIDLQQGGDLGTMQAMTAAIVKSFDLSRR